MKRKFTCVIGKKENGIYTGSSPSSAARKATSKLCSENKKLKVNFCLRETTQGSKKKVYGPYEGKIEKLKEPIELKGRIVRYKPIVRLLEKKGGGVRVFEAIIDEEGNKIKVVKYSKSFFEFEKIATLRGKEKGQSDYEVLDMDDKIIIKKGSPNIVVVELLKYLRAPKEYKNFINNSNKIDKLLQTLDKKLTKKDEIFYKIKVFTFYWSIPNEKWDNFKTFLVEEIGKDNLLKDLLDESKTNLNKKLDFTINDKIFEIEMTNIKDENRKFNIKIKGPSKSNKNSNQNLKDILETLNYYI